VPEPGRFLAAEGRAFWDRVWTAAVFEAASPVAVEMVQTLAEQIDERLRLRQVVIRDQGWRDRTALRALDGQVMAGLVLLAERLEGGVSDFTSSLSDLLAEMDDPA